MSIDLLIADIEQEQLKDNDEAAFDRGLVFYFAGNLELPDRNHIFRPGIAP